MTQVTTAGLRRHDRHVHAVAGYRASSARTSRACSSPGRRRSAGSRMRGYVPARLPRRRREERQDLPGHRRRAVLDPRRPGPPARRRHRRDARPRLGHDQLRRREDLRRGGRGCARPPSRGVRRGGVRTAERAVGPGGRRHRAAARGRRAGPEIRARLLDECAKHIARYKLPKQFVFVDQVVRSPAGKADYRWAKEVAGRRRPDLTRPARSANVGAGVRASRLAAEGGEVGFAVEQGARVEAVVDGAAAATPSRGRCRPISASAVGRVERGLHAAQVGRRCRATARPIAASG